MTTAVRTLADYYGCRPHAVAAAEVATWWQAAEARDLHVGMCVCCTGPCRIDSRGSRCKRCEVGE